MGGGLGFMRELRENGDGGMIRGVLGLGFVVVCFQLWDLYRLDFGGGSRMLCFDLD